MPHDLFHKKEEKKANDDDNDGNADDEDEETENKVRDFKTPFFLADRGECSFVDKVRNIEESGAAVAIIVDNKRTENVSRIVMSDDGSGAGLRIPSMMISYSDGQKLIDFMNVASQDEIDQISIMVEFDMKRPDNRVEYDVWYSSNNDLALDFL